MIFILLSHLGPSEMDLSTLSPSNWFIIPMTMSVSNRQFHHGIFYKELLCSRKYVSQSISDVDESNCHSFWKFARQIPLPHGFLINFCKGYINRKLTSFFSWSRFNDLKKLMQLSNPFAVLTPSGSCFRFLPAVGSSRQDFSKMQQQATFPLILLESADDQKDCWLYRRK